MEVLEMNEKETIQEFIKEKKMPEDLLGLSRAKLLCELHTRVRAKRQELCDLENLLSHTVMVGFSTEEIEGECKEAGA